MSLSIVRRFRPFTTPFILQAKRSCKRSAFDLWSRRAPSFARNVSATTARTMKKLVVCCDGIVRVQLTTALQVKLIENHRHVDEQRRWHHKGRRRKHSNGPHPRDPHQRNANRPQRRQVRLGWEHSTQLLPVWHWHLRHSRQMGRRSFWPRLVRTYSRSLPVYSGKLRPASRR